MKIIHYGGYTKEELKKLKDIVYSNILHDITNLITGMEKLNIEFENEQNKVITHLNGLISI